MLFLASASLFEASYRMNQRNLSLHQTTALTTTTTAVTKEKSEFKKFALLAKNP